MFDGIELHVSAGASVLRLLLAVIFGALIGWDREQRGHDAGFRTHILVCLGAATFTLVGIEWFEALQASGTTGSDPMRIMAAIVGGVGFLGAGAIMQSGREVRGLTTAAGLWVVAGIGLATGAGAYVLAFTVTALAFVTLALAKRLSRTIGPDDRATNDDAESS